MTVSAMYPGTFDPITLGHEDLVRRSVRVFERVVIAIAADTMSKAPMFNLEERVDLAKAAVGDIDSVEVMGYEGLTVDFARDNDLSVIIRGLRAVSDFDYESQMALMNRQLFPELETVFLVPAVDLTYLSSSLVREVAGLGGDVSDLVHPVVERALAQKFTR